MAFPGRAMQRGSDSKSRTQSAAGCISCGDPPCANLHTPGLLFPTLSPRVADGWSLVRDGLSWRQSASRSVSKPCGETASAQPSDDYAAHAHWCPFGSWTKHVNTNNNHSVSWTLDICLRVTIKNTESNISRWTCSIKFFFKSKNNLSTECSSCFK